MAIQQEYLSARDANERRYAQAMSIYDEIIKRYQPGGTFGKAALGQLETQKVRDVGAETQQMISSGLYGTTTTAGLPGKWEAEVGAPARLRLEDIMMERLSQAQIGKAGFIERREDVYPDVGMAAGFAQETAQAAPTSTWGQYDPDYMTSLFGGGGAGTQEPTTGAGQSPLQLRLAAQNRERAEAERERRAGTATTVSPTTYPQAMAATPTQQEVGMTGGMGTLPGMTEAKSSASQIDAEYQKFVEGVYARGSYITSGTKQRWMKQQGYS